MSSVETKNYVICLRNHLGSGSFGDVCLGYHRSTEEPVAIKAFKRNVPKDTLSQEFGVLKCVQHENIVRLIDVDWNRQVGNFLVMELCSEGSLLNVLQSPGGFYGLAEEEFLILLGDMTAGMRYLRGKNFIHRDIKPGNVLRSRRRNGEYIYKLSDFGSARVLGDDESFSSIWGTAEYLHPDMYRVYATKASEKRNFSATVDLWSAGVTLYHAATGKVPFRKLQVLTQKPTGAISGGAQAEPNGWEEELPESCRWYPEFKVVIGRLLRGLLEVEPQSTWSFERFFGEVDEILALRKIVVFHANRLRFLGVYLKPGEGRPQLEEAILRLTSSATPHDHLLVYKYDLLGELGDVRYTKAEPLVLIGGKRESGRSCANFLRTPLPLDAKQLEINEHVNANLIKDVAILPGLCKNVVALIENIALRRRNELQVRTDCLIKLTRMLNRNKLAPTTTGLPVIPPVLQDEHGAFRKLENCASEIGALQAKVRAYAKKVNPKSPYLLRTVENLLSLYSSCEAQTQTLADHVDGWCENVAVVFGKVKAKEKHLDEWSDQVERRAGLQNETAVTLGERLGQLEDDCRDIAGLIHSQSSVIQEMITTSNKSLDDLRRQEN